MLACAGSALAGEPIVYEHNGSIMHWVEDADSITITYEQPRSGLASVGVVPGTVLFVGSYQGAGFAGEAYTFKHGCWLQPTA